MREDDTTTAVPDHESDQPHQSNEVAAQAPADVPETTAESSPAQDSPAQAEPADAEKPKRRPTRRRSTSTAGKPAAADETPAPETNADPEPPANDTADKPAAAGKHEAVGKREDEADKPEAATPEGAKAESNPFKIMEPEAAEPEESQAGTVEKIDDEGDEQETEVQSFVTSLAPQLSHVEAGQAEIEISPPAAFNPFALFQAPEEVTRPAPAVVRAERTDDASFGADETEDGAEQDNAERDDDSSDDDGDSSSRRRRRGRRGRGRRADGDDSGDNGNDTDDSNGNAKQPEKESGDKQQPSARTTQADNGTQDDKSAQDNKDSSDDTTNDDEGESGSRRRRRRRRRGSDSDSDSNGASSDSSDSSADKVRGVSGSVRLEAKRQRRKEGRDHGRRRAPILTEAEFLARRESVTRKMVVRQQGERTQIAVLEDDVLVEHYVTLATEQSFAGGVYLGRVQNVLPSMEAAFIDIGKRRNAVLYAGEVNWDAAGLEGRQRNIEQALKSGDKVLAQVTKDPIGHKGARLTSQISLPGRYLVYVPSGSMTGISRKLPEQERSRLKEILRRIVPDDAGVIIRTAAEGATEEELNRDVQRLKAQWEVIEQKSKDSKTKAPSVLYEEPDLAIRVVRDLFNEDFAQMTVSGDDAWDTISPYIEHVAPELVDRISKSDADEDVFKEHRIDEQLTKALDRKVWLPSGGSLVIDRTEAMTVIDVNTGKFTGSGGNLEQTVTKNNLEAAEEIVRQLRLRDIGGIVVIDFIDMLLESNRELVMRRLTECLGRDRTKHQVAEVTSLGLVQMTRKRVGQGLLDAFSEPCPHCDGRGIIVHSEPIEKKTASTATEPTSRRNSRSRRGANRETQNNQSNDEPRRDSTSKLSAIAAATHKDESSDSHDDASGGPADRHSKPAEQQSASQQRKPVDQQRKPEGQPNKPEGQQSAEETTERRPVARRRRAARRPAGPPTSSPS